MKLCVVGISHKTAPIEIREKLAFADEKIPRAFHELKKIPRFQEVVILSTCNRVEIYAVSETLESFGEAIKNFICQFHQISRNELDRYFYHYESQEAVRHGLRVASGLDSMVLGESQILGQMKEAYQKAAQHQMTSSFLNRYFHRVFSAAKRGRSETQIAQIPVSVSYVAVLLAKQIFGSLEHKKTLLLGAGKMSEIAAKHLKSQQNTEIWVANRSAEKAASLAAACEGKVIHYDDFILSLPLVDVVIVSTGAPHFLITPEAMQEVMRLRKNQPMFIIDISVPRNVDPAINRLYNIYLYDLDDLQSVVAENQKERQHEAKRIEVILEEEYRLFEKQVYHMHLAPTIQMLSQKFEEIRKKELDKVFLRMKDLSLDQKEGFEACTTAIVNKILHDPLLAMKDLSLEAPEEHRQSFHAMIQKLFKLDGPTQ
ncbi:MAG: glutamyl-tRNA reductase [Deltaproteobacteria bacterium]|nr:glutamyl-tRNA reductase [Deltaproteobacteria bacterium]